MNAILELEQEVKELPLNEYSDFREWFLQYDNEVWDNQIKNDSENGFLDFLINEVKDDMKTGKFKQLFNTF